MSGSTPEKSKLADSILTATSSASPGTAAPEKSPSPSDSPPFVSSPTAQKLRLGEILTTLKVEQLQTPGWVVVGGPGPADSLMGLEASDVSAALWDAASNKIYLSSRSNGLVALDCAAISCPVPSWQKRLTLALLAGLVDRLPFPFSLASHNFPNSTQP